LRDVPFNPIGALQILVGHGVRFVVIGGYAGRLWGSNTITDDLDICYARDRKNLEALAAALRELKATLRGAPADVPFLLDAETLRKGDHFTLSTKCGDLDCLGTPQGSDGYLDLVRGATRMSMGSIEVLVVALEDLIRMKRSAGRLKDLVELEILGALREEIEKARQEKTLDR
jgi:hypothetical protein